MKKLLLAVGIIFLFLSSCVTPITFGYNLKTSIEKEQEPTVIEESIDHIWPMHKYNAQCTGQSPYDTSQNKGGEKWKYFNDEPFAGSVAIDKDGIIYASSSSIYGDLHAVYPNGKRKWKKEISFGEYQTPAIAPDGTIYVGTMKWLYAYNPDGTRKWKFDIEENYFCEPVVDSNGTVYTATQDGYVYAVYSNGTLKWKYYVADYIFYIALDRDENVYFGGHQYTDKLYCLNPNGSLKWSYEKFDMIGSPVIDDNGIIYIIPRYWLVALYPNGTEKWIVDIELEWTGYPSIAHDGTIILSGGREYITAFNPVDGSIIWQYKIGEWPLIGQVSNAAIGADGSIYFSYEAYSDTVAFLVALNPDGSLKWETSLTTDIHPYDFVHVSSDPSIGSDGTVYITSWFGRGGSNYTDIGYIHAIGMDNPIAPEPPTIIGSHYAKLFRIAQYTLKSNLPAGIDVYYFIDWDDELSIENYDNKWIGPYPSDEEVKVYHFWKFWGDHTIKVKIKTDDSLCSHNSLFDVKVRFLRSGENYNPDIILRILERFPLIGRLLNIRWWNLE
jgi:hypothetical protein